MIKLTAIFLIFTNLLFSCSSSYQLCQQKLQDSNSLNKKYAALPIGDKIVGFSYSYDPSTMSKYDPFLGLFEAKQKATFAHPFITKLEENATFAIVSKNRVEQGKFISNQLGLSTLAKFSKHIFEHSVVLSNCCTLVGIVTPRGIIQKTYFEHFLNSKNISYGDVGARFVQKNSKIYVESIDPFFKQNMFRQGDQILKSDGSNVGSMATFLQKILFSKKGKTINFEVKRGNHIKKFSVTTDNLQGGGLKSDTYFERIGVIFDNNLKIVNISSNNGYGLKNGDKLIQIDGKKVATQQDVRVKIGSSSEVAQLLFERDGFMFFINLNL
jgi:hypothetical protein